MENPLSRYMALAKRWIWLILLGVVICSIGTYVVSKRILPVYRASAFLDVTFQSSTSPYENTTAALEVVPTYAKYITNPSILAPVLALHHGMTLTQLEGMITVNPVANATLIELDIDNSNPQLAAQLANEISQNFAQYANSQLPAVVHIIPAVAPTSPIRPQPTTYALIGALVGLGLSLAMIVVFEWLDDRLTRLEEVQELLGWDTLAIIPRLSDTKRGKIAEANPAFAERCRTLCANLNAAQHIKPLKLVMICSALADEGKSSIIVNIASFLAETGKRVLLVDADLRRGILSEHFQIDNSRGLSQLLQEGSSEVDLQLYVQPTEIPNLSLLTAGVPLSNPADLLQSQMAVRVFDSLRKDTHFDYVLFDTPPLLPVADAQILACYVQAILFVVDGSKTPRKALRLAKETLNRSGARVLGVVLNKSYWTDHSEIRQYLRTIDKYQTTSGQHFPQPPTTQSTEDQMLQDTQILDRKDEKKPHENGYRSDSADPVASTLNTMAPLLDVDSEFIENRKMSIDQ